jgi:hypothetical protein
MEKIANNKILDKYYKWGVQRDSKNAVGSSLEERVCSTQYLLVYVQASTLLLSLQGLATYCCGF